MFNFCTPFMPLGNLATCFIFKRIPKVCGPIASMAFIMRVGIGSRPIPKLEMGRPSAQINPTRPFVTDIVTT